MTHIEGDEPREERTAGAQPPRWRVRVHRLERPYRPAFAEHERAVAALQAELPELAAAVERHLGEHGRMISASKSRYYRRYPSRLVVFNANVLVARRKVWWGDLDLTVDVPKLKAVARELGCELHVLREHDGRFGGRDHEPLVDRYVYWTDGRRQRLGERTGRAFGFRRGRPRRRRREGGS